MSSNKACLVPGCRNPGTDRHHVLPVEFGGPSDGALVLLCASHHDEIHRLHNQVKANKLALSSIADPVIRELVIKINQQYLEYVKTGIAPDARRRVMFHCTEEELKMVHVLRDNGGYTSIDAMFKTWLHSNFNKMQAGK